jgi:hypothetical protein
VPVEVIADRAPGRRDLQVRIPQVTILQVRMMGDLQDFSTLQNYFFTTRGRNFSHCDASTADGGARHVEGLRRGRYT